MRLPVYAALLFLVYVAVPQGHPLSAQSTGKTAVAPWQSSWEAYLTVLKPLLASDPSGLKAEKELADRDVTWTGTLADNVDFSKAPTNINLVMGTGSIPFMSDRGKMAEAKNILQITIKPGSIEAWQRVPKGKPVRFRARVGLPYVVLSSGGVPILLLPAKDGEPMP